MIRTKKTSKSIKKINYNRDEITAEESDYQNAKSEKKEKKTSVLQSHKMHR